MKRFLSLILIISLLFSLAACSDKGANKAIAYALNASPATLDPQYAKETEAMIIINNTFEGLTRLSADGTIIPGIAEKWSVSPDGLTYTFNLKPGTEWYCPLALKSEFGDDFYKKFSEEKVTANDFVFAMRRAVSPKFSSPYAHRLFVIENAMQISSGALEESALGVTAADDNTLIIKLSEQCPDLLERLTEGVFMPCNEEFFEAMGGRYGLTFKHILCNGPFYVSTWDPEVSLSIRRNKYYAGEQTVLPSSVNFSFVSNFNAVADGLATASISAALLPPDCETPENTETVSQSEDFVFGFSFNCSDAYLKNLDLRLALCRSIDRSLFSGEFGNAKEQSGFVPPSCSAGGLNYREAVGSQTPELTYDSAAAAQLWAKGASALAADKILIEVLCPEWLDSAVRRQLQLWQQIMGINLGISVVNKTPEEINQAVAAGNYQIALTGIESPYESAVDFLTSFKGGGAFRFASAEYDALIDRLLKTGSGDELLSGCFTAETYILQNAICYPVYSRSSRFVTADEIEGITINGSESSVSFIGAKRYD